MAQPRPFTVLDITKWYGETSGGVRTYLDAKAGYVGARQGLRHVLVIPGDRDEVVDRGTVRRYRLRGPRIPSQRQYRFLLAPRTLRAIIERERPDVIEVGSPIFVPWITSFAVRGWRIPLVGFYHTSIRSALTPMLGALAPRATAGYVRRLDRLFRTTFVASDMSELELRAAGANRLTRVPLGVDLDVFRPRSTEERTRFRGELGLSVDERIVTYLGRLAPEKGMETVFDAWLRFGESLDATLVVMGEGPLRAAFMQRTRGRRVRWLPFSADRARVATLLASSDVYLAPGPSETFGLAAIEAMACATPVLSADRGGVAEHVRKGGGGALFDAGSATSLGMRLLEILTGRDACATRAAAGARGRAYAERHYAWPAAFDRIFDTYRAVAEQ